MPEYLITEFNVAILWKVVISFFKLFLVKITNPDLSFSHLAQGPSTDMNFPSPSLKQKSINSLRPFNILSRGIFVHKVEKSEDEIDVIFPLLLSLLRASVTGWLFKACLLFFIKFLFFHQMIAL